MAGLLQGVYAFAGIVHFWDVQRHIETEPDDILRASVLLRALAVDHRARHRHPARPGVLTPTGVRFVTALRERRTAARCGPVPAEAIEIAREVALDNWLTWQLRHTAVDAGGVAGLAAAFRRGEPLGGQALPEARIEDDIRKIDSIARSRLLNLRFQEPQRYRQLSAAEIPELGAADALLIRGDASAAVAAYREGLAAEPDPAAWIGLALAVHRLPATPSRAGIRQPAAAAIRNARVPGRPGGPRRSAGRGGLVRMTTDACTAQQPSAVAAARPRRGDGPGKRDITPFPSGSSSSRCIAVAICRAPIATSMKWRIRAGGGCPADEPAGGRPHRRAHRRARGKRTACPASMSSCTAASRCWRGRSGCRPGRLAPRRVPARVNVAMQTNGTLLDRPMLSTLKRLGIRVGVSLDGDAEATGRHRRYANGRNSFDAVAEGLDLLRSPEFRGLLQRHPVHDRRRERPGRAPTRRC